MSTPRKETCDCCGKKIALVKFGWKFGECEQCGYTVCEECLPNDIMSGSCGTCPKCRHYGATVYSRGKH